jgi:hypothetical protein
MKADNMMNTIECVRSSFSHYVMNVIVCVCVCVQISSNSFLVLSFCVLFLIERNADRFTYIYYLSDLSYAHVYMYIYTRNHHAYRYIERVVVVSMVYAPPPIYDE